MGFYLHMHKKALVHITSGTATLMPVGSTLKDHMPELKYKMCKIILYAQQNYYNI